ncbi:hypothetical protein CVT24_011335 [Panaeolus cyanescens]|uniref:G domain-containing protein n=1 Tax=Panaeolus cyanescens TaxID=181874 RepID=A0A409WE52_9AGAR|nr:hypothetical protein CVT24_011335 [Panaeolus cyanescens]
MDNTSNLGDLRITGPVSVEQQTAPLPAIKPYCILLLGLTGTGKSNFNDGLTIKQFIEVLSGGADLKISGNSLESVTQNITLYRLVNVEFSAFSRPIFLIDCPGFCDNKTSEFKLITMIQEWMHNVAIQGILPEARTISTILYFHRITDKRLSSTQRETLRLIGSLVGDPYHNQTRLAIVTTMWDTLWRPTQIEEAEIRFTQLKESIKQFLGPIADQALRFHNTQNSALHIINDADTMCLPPGVLAIVQRSLRESPLRTFSNQNLRNAPFADQLLKLLQDRISRLEQSIRILDDDIQQLEQDGESDPSSRDELRGMKSNAEEALRTVASEHASLVAVLQREPVTRPSIARRFLNYMQNNLPSGSQS